MSDVRVHIVSPGTATYTQSESITVAELLQRLLGSGELGNVLQSQGEGLPPVWGAGLAGDTVVTVSQGGTGMTTESDALNNLLPFTTFGDTLYGGLAGVATVLSGNASTQRKFMKSSGNNTTPSDPSWEALTVDDIPQIGLTIGQWKSTCNQVSIVTGTATINMATHNIHRVTLADSDTTALALDGEATGQILTLFLQQGATGSGLATWWPQIYWPGGTAPTLTTTATAIDAFQFFLHPTGFWYPLNIFQNLLLPS